jgi:hypothetical protein
MRNLGRFILSAAFMSSEAYWLLASKVRFLEVDYDPFRNGYYCIGNSLLFDMVASGSEIPEYKITLI